MRIGIVGVGQISHAYLRQETSDPRIEFVATCARRLDNAQLRAAQYGVASAFDDYEEMYDTARPDVVIIATPTVHHLAPALAALNRGIHVVCEKPMASSLDGCQAMVEAARDNGVLLRLQSDPGIIHLAQREYLTVERMGQFVGAEAEILIPGPGRDNWYYDRQVAGGGAMLDTLIYPVSAIVGLLGPVVRVAAMVNTLIPHRLVGPAFPAEESTTVVQSDVDDNVTLILEWATGQQAVLRALWGTSFSRLDLNVFGRRGTLFGSSFGRSAVLHSPGRPVPGATSMQYEGLTDCYQLPLPFPNQQRFAGLDLMIDAIEGTRAPSWSGDQQLHVHEILFKAYQAARTGTTQVLDTTFDPWHPLDPAFFDTRSGIV